MRTSNKDILAMRPMSTIANMRRHSSISASRWFVGSVGAEGMVVVGMVCGFR